MSGTTVLNKHCFAILGSFRRWPLLLAVSLVISGLGAQTPSRSPDLGLSNFAVVPPELTGGVWLNVPRGTKPTLKSRRGRVTVVHFWTFACINCKRNLSFYAQWQNRFASRGLQVIGVHTPETESERNVTNVVQKVKELRITYPVLIDQDTQNWKRWNQRYWPTVYLIDKQGRARLAWEGELEYQGRGGTAKLTAMIEKLLQE